MKKFIYVKAKLVSNRYSREMEIEGEWTKDQLEHLRDDIGRDFVIGSRNASFNLKYFDTIIFTKIGE